MYYSPIRSNELYHFGVKGMHWGIRRYQNPDGTLTEAGQKRYYNADGSHKTGTMDARKYHRQQRNKIINKDVNISGRYDETTAGKKNLKAYQDAYDKAAKNDTGSDWKNFYKSEDKYLGDQGRYVANNLLKEIGAQKFRYYVTNGKRSNKSTEELIDDFIKEYKTIHAM